MGWFDKLKGMVMGGAASASPVGAIATAVGNIAGAVQAGEQLADHKQLINAGEAKGTVKDVQKTEERVGDALDARNDDKLRDDVKAKHYRD